MIRLLSTFIFSYRHLRDKVNLLLKDRLNKPRLTNSLGRCAGSVIYKTNILLIEKRDELDTHVF